MYQRKISKSIRQTTLTETKSLLPPLIFSEIVLAKLKVNYIKSWLLTYPQWRLMTRVIAQTTLTSYLWILEQPCFKRTESSWSKPNLCISVQKKMTLKQPKTKERGIKVMTRIQLRTLISIWSRWGRKLLALMMKMLFSLTLVFNSRRSSTE